MALVGTDSVLALLALASSIYWAAALAPSDSAPAVMPPIVAFVGAALIAATASYAVARQCGRTSLAPLVIAAVVSVAVSEDGRMLIGGVWPLTVPVTVALCAYSARGVDRLRVVEGQRQLRRPRAGW